MSERKRNKNVVTTRSGKTIKLNRSLGDRMRASKDARARKRAEYLSTLPKEKWKRLLYRLHPKRLAQYWFSRDGAIMALKIVGVGVLVVFIFVIGMFAYFRKDLPKIHDLNNGNGGGNIAIYDKTGKTLIFQDYGAFKRTPVDGTQISQYVKDATIAVEDKNFYHEGAFNLKGITRAALNNLKGGSTQGGSTLTQQLVKLNEGWTNDHTISRKVKELILAVELEREYSKDDILTAYLNTAPYSGLDYGVQAAAQDYFHVNANQLSIAQAAMLAAIPKSPTAYSPYSSPSYNPQASGYNFDQNGLIARQQYIIELMQDQGYITAAQAKQAKAEDIMAQVQPMPTTHYAGLKTGYAYAVQAIEEELNKDFPAAVVKSGSWKVISTIDTNLQDLAVNSINNNASKLSYLKVDDAAFVGEDTQTGQIVSLVGGRDFNSQQLNMASDTPISPGSSIKPYTYATLINNNNNVGAGSVLYDTQGALPGYPCTDKSTPEHGGNCLFDDTRKYSGGVTLRYALGSSLNVPAVKAFTTTDPDDTSAYDPANGAAWHLPSINTTMKSIRNIMADPDGYRCYDGTKLAEEGRTIGTATKEDETQCYSAAGIGNEAYTTLQDHVNGIATISREGSAIPTTLILQVTNSNGKVVKKFEQPKGNQVLKPQAAYIVSDMAADGGASYLGASFHNYKGWRNGIKTGTNGDVDGLMMSWNAKYTAGVWIGNYDRSESPVLSARGPETATQPIMKAWMEGAIDDLGAAQPQNWTVPSGLQTLPAYHSAVPFSAEKSPPANDLFPSWYVGNKQSGGSTSQAVDKVSGLLATTCTPTAAKQLLGGAISALNADLYSGGNPNIGGKANTDTSKQQYDNVHTCSDTPPTVQITASSSFMCPATGDCTVPVYVSAGTDGSSLRLLNDPKYPQFTANLVLTVNGQTVNATISPTLNDSDGTDYTITFTPPSGSTSLNLTATVTDNILYQNSDSVTVPVETATVPTGNTPPGGINH